MPETWLQGHVLTKNKYMKLPEIHIVITYKGAKRSELRTITTSRHIYEVLKEMFNTDTIEWSEEMILICLSKANKVLGFYRVSSGGITGTICDPKVVYTIALNCAGTCNIIIAHNHPSGNLRPSQADESLTQKIKGAGLLLDIKLLDHLIYTDEGYYSFSDEGML